MVKNVLSVEEYEKRVLVKLLKDAGVEPEHIVRRFTKMRDEYCARLIERLAKMEPDVAVKTAAKFLNSPHPFDKTIGAWLARRETPSTPLKTLYV